MTDERRQSARRVTIEDVATHARVSRAAVSKVLRDAYGVSDEMRDRVNTSIAALQYRPQISARGMRGSTFTIGVMVSDVNNTFFTEVLDGAMAEIAGSPFQVIIGLVEEPTGESYRAIESLYDRQVDGILAISPLAEPEWLDDMARKVPLVQLGLHLSSTAFDTIAGDDAHGVTQMMTYLFGLGHRRIAYVSHSDRIPVRLPSRPHVIREHLYEQLMTEAGLADEMTIVHARFEEEVAYAESKRAFEAGLRPTAIFAGNDDAAFGTMRAMAEFPELGRTSISGYDDSRVAANPRISLTTINQSGREMGHQAVRLLLERVDGRSESRYVELPTRLVVRDSTFPPAPGA